MHHARTARPTRQHHFLTLSSVPHFQLPAEPPPERPAASRRVSSCSLATATLAALTLLLLVTTGCATSGVNQGDVNFVSMEQEWQLGMQLEKDLASQLDLVRNRQVVNAVSEMGRKLVAQTEMANVPWEFHVVRDPAINAFNIPGGHVYVNTGLIENAGNAAELAGVLAHEIAHGVSRHGTEGLTRAYGLNIVASLLVGENAKLYEQLLAQVAGTGTMAHFSREAEREADILGVHMMHRAGYDPMGMATMFEELLRNRQRRPSDVEQFFASHPLTETRIAAVRAEARSLPSQGVRTDTQNFRRLKNRVAR